MAIVPDISLGVRPPQVQSPLDVFRSTASIADMLAQVQERRAQSAAIAEEAPLRRAKLAAETQQFAEQNALKQAYDGSIGYDDQAGDITYDQGKGSAILKGIKMPNGNDAGYLLPQYQSGMDAQRKAHRQQALDELTQTNQKLKLVAEPLKNFLSETDEGKRKAAYPDVRTNLVAADPAHGKLLPYDYDKDVVERQFQPVVDAYERTKDTAEKLADRQKEETIALTTPEGREAEIARQVQELTSKGGKPPDQETLDAIREGVMQKAGFTGFKIVRKTPGRAQFSPPMDASRAPADAATVTGEPIDRTPGKQVIAVYHGGEVIGYQPFEPKQTTFQQKTARIERAYAMTIGKKPEQLTDAEKVAADAWYTKQLPNKQTEIDKRLEIYERSPELYQALFGHGGSAADKPVTPEGKARILGRINAEITKQGLEGKEADTFKAQRFQELRDAGIEMAGPAARPAPVPAVPNKSSLPKPTPMNNTATDATYQAYRKVYKTHEATIKAMQADKWQ